MDEDSASPAKTNVLDTLGAVRDSLSVRRVFGDPYEVGDTTVIPVAVVRGGAGGGSGEGSGPDGMGMGSGNGMGFGVIARPLGVYRVQGDSVEWIPAVDVTGITLAQLLLAGLAVVSLRGLLRRRRRRH
ncbi:MAG TPA: spore germination protein GerW family protein [Acidimicrobiales bacterium]|jgi:uncharacterized spore protein YtfJ